MCAPLKPSDEGKSVVRLDGLTRNNATVMIGNTVVVRRMRALKAEKMVVMLLEPIPIIDERYFTEALQGIPVTVNDHVMIPYFGGRLTFKIIEIVLEPGQDTEAAGISSNSSSRNNCQNKIWDQGTGREQNKISPWRICQARVRY